LARFPRDGNQIAYETFSPHDLKLKEIAMKHLGSAVVVTVGLLAVGATTASAAVVCNGEGDCWRTKERYTYPPDAGVRVYSDDWKWGPDDKYRWREHEGRGYWGPKGAWIEF
jgi:hypothetical protein